MEKNALAAKTKQEYLAEIFMVDFRTNGIYPQMLGPKILSLGTHFLDLYLGRFITFEDYQNDSAEAINLNSYYKRVAKLHSAYGKVIPDQGISENRVLSLYLQTKQVLGNLLTCLIGEDKHLYEYFTNEANRSEVADIYRLFKAGNSVLDTEEMKHLSKLYRDSLRSVLEQGSQNMDRSDLIALKTEWGDFSNRFSGEVIHKISFENKRSKNKFPEDRFENFIQELKTLFTVEVTLF
ncbi:hypothetical protein KBD45_08060 [Candidatus Dojkabacteria bacterium]|nr:hypothetical protein [Candidatus Dojkabacteria bacterium]